MLWTYFVNWDKVTRNTRALEVNLNILNYLIGKDNFDEEFKALVTEHPEVVSALPVLAVRDGDNTKIFQIISSIENRQIVYEEFNFTNTAPSNDDIEKYLEFVTKTGVRELFSANGVKNLVDYVYKAVEEFSQQYGNTGCGVFKQGVQN